MRTRACAIAIFIYLDDDPENRFCENPRHSACMRDAYVTQ
ncbi:hypothetical protein BSLA_01f0603 [Burkholderia stabilis]|nr:hypothetical protein BSLA_01f0603 [Burkholderia stabilis]